MLRDRILFLVRREGSLDAYEINNVVVPAAGREEAKRQARSTLRGDPDQYVVTPISRQGDRTLFMLDI